MHTMYPQIASFFIHFYLNRPQHAGILSPTRCRTRRVRIPPLPLTAQQTAQVIELLKNPPAGEAEFLLELLTHRVPAGVDDAAQVKASYLAALAFGEEKNELIDPEHATRLLEIGRAHV